MELDDIAFNARCAQENESQRKFNNRSKRDKDKSQFGIVRSHDAKRLTVERSDGTTETRENFSRAGAGIGQVFPLEGTCNNGTQGLDTLEPRRLKIEDDNPPIFVNRRRPKSCFENIFSVLYCESPYTFEDSVSFDIETYTRFDRPSFDPNAPLTELESCDCCFISRNGTEENARAISLLTIDYSIKTVKFVQGDISRVCESQLTFANGGCDGDTYTQYEIIQCFPSGAKNTYFVQENPQYKKQCLQLAKGDTHLIYEETVSRGGTPAILGFDSYTTYSTGNNGGEDFYFADNYVWVDRDWDFANPTDNIVAGTAQLTNDSSTAKSLNGIVRVSYSWTITSWPSLQYSISGSGEKLTSGLSYYVDGTRPVIENTGPFCEQSAAFFTVDANAHIPGLSDTASILIPITTKPSQESPMTISSANTKDYAAVWQHQQSYQTYDNFNWLQLGEQNGFANPDGVINRPFEKLDALRLPDEYRDDFISGKFPHRGDVYPPSYIAYGVYRSPPGVTVNGSAPPSHPNPNEYERSYFDYMSPNVVIPNNIACCEFVYTLNTELNDGTCHFRLFEEGEFDVEDENGNNVTPSDCYDWRTPIKSDPIEWDQPCKDEYWDNGYANVDNNNVLYIVTPALIQSALAQPIGTSSDVSMNCKSLLSIDGACSEQDKDDKTITVPGIEKTVSVNAIGGNRIKCKYLKR